MPLAGPLLVLMVFGADAPSFEREIAPLLAHRCLTCHTGDDAKGALDLTLLEKARRGGESGPALVPRDLAASGLWQRVEADEMPPKHPLPAAEKELLKLWIEAGAEWTTPIDPLRYSSSERAGYDWWSLQPLRRAEAPRDETGWSIGPIDRFVQAARSKAGLTAAPKAERATLIRRLTFDLWGLPPSPEEIAAFVADDDPLAVERLVDRLLASPHYGERWARHWLDVVRFGESNGFERDLPRPYAWHYRDWVIRAFNADLPYDEFVRQQLAADRDPAGDLEPWQALGFLVAGPHDTVVPVVDRMRQVMRQDELEDLIGTVGQTFLGLTVNCARCHDHKFDPISSKEYYQLAAALAGVNHAEREIMPAAAQQQLSEWDREIKQLDSTLQQQAEPHRRAILADRRTDGTAPSISVSPSPLAAWDFRTGLRDLAGVLHGEAVGEVTTTSEGIVLNGQSFVVTPPIQKGLTAKTLEVRVKLKDLDQRGGGAITVQAPDGHQFDSIVFGEQEPKRWMAGSSGFVRTLSFQGPEETRAAQEFVTFAIVYQADGVIVGYRNGEPYGVSFRKTEAATYPAGEAQVVFGLRHSPAGGNRHLRGTIAGAKLYDRALTPEEIRASFAVGAGVVTEPEILARLSPEERTDREQRTARLSALRTQHAALLKSAPVKMYTVQLTPPPPQAVLRRGDVTSRGEAVVPAGLAAVNALPASFELKADAIERQRRERLGDWITDRRNPLFARVMVNRLWHYHFGQGLVSTPNDLGFHGGRPTHPELLDWLASELVASGYSLKHMHRLLVLSATYQQSSALRPELAKRDAENRWLWRMSPRRLDAESVRDAMLSAAGMLNDTVGGQSYSDFNSFFFKGTQFYEPRDPTTADHHRRTVYRMWARGGRNPFLDTFDCPDPSTTTPKRSVTTTPLQALSLMNHSFVLRMSDAMASRLQANVGPQPVDQARQAYLLLFGRTPTVEESRIVEEFIRRHGLASACRGLFNASEGLYVD